MTNPYFTTPHRNGVSQQPKNQGPSVGEIIAEKSKKLKNKFLNFMYERKGYKRVNVNNNSNLGNC